MDSKAEYSALSIAHVSRKKYKKKKLKQIVTTRLEIAQLSQWRARGKPLFRMVPSLTPFDLPFPQNRIPNMTDFFCARAMSPLPNYLGPCSVSLCFQSSLDIPAANDAIQVVRRWQMRQVRGSDSDQSVDLVRRADLRACLPFTTRLGGNFTHHESDLSP